MSDHNPEFSDGGSIPSAVSFIASLLIWVGGAASVLIALFGTLDALSSLFRGRPLTGVVEFTQLALVVLIFTAQPYVLLHHAHIRLDLLKFRPGSFADTAGRSLTVAAALLCYGLIAYTSWPSFLTSLEGREYTEGILALPVYPVKGLLFLGSAVAFLIVLFFLVGRILKKISGSSCGAGATSWTP